MLAKIINNKFSPIRERRFELSKRPEYIKEILKAGKEKARPVAQEVLERVNNIVGISL